MDNLKEIKCEPCRIGAPKLSDSEIDELLENLPTWRLRQKQELKFLERKFDFNNFAEALEFTNRVGSLAESEGHHPAIITEWGKVTVQYWTHKIYGLHKNDFIMAAKTDELMNE